MRRDFLIKIGSQVWLRMAVDCVYFGPQGFLSCLTKQPRWYFTVAPTSFTPPGPKIPSFLAISWTGGVSSKKRGGTNLDIASWQQLTLQISRVIPDFTRKQANIFARLWSLCHWVSNRKECNTALLLVFLLCFWSLFHSKLMVWSSTSQEPSKKVHGKCEKCRWQSCLARPALQWYFIVAVVGGDRSNWEIDMIFIYIYTDWIGRTWGLSCRTSDSAVWTPFGGAKKNAAAGSTNHLGVTWFKAREDPGKFRKTLREFLTPQSLSRGVRSGNLKTNPSRKHLDERCKCLSISWSQIEAVHSNMEIKLLSKNCVAARGCRRWNWHCEQMNCGFTRTASASPRNSRNYINTFHGNLRYPPQSYPPNK